MHAITAITPYALLTAERPVALPSVDYADRSARTPTDTNSWSAGTLKSHRVRSDFISSKVMKSFALAVVVVALASPALLCPLEARNTAGCPTLTALIIPTPPPNK